jgi:hypothetical protein
MGRGDVADSGDLNEGRLGQIWMPGWISRVRDGDGRTRCSMRTILRCSWIKVEGRVRLVLRRGVNLGREGGQKGSRMVAIFSSSLHSNLEFLFFFPVIEQGGGLWGLGGLGGGVGAEWG